MAMKKSLLSIAIFCILSAWNFEDSFLTLLHKQLESYNLFEPYEEVYITFNQNKYVPKDTAFFICHLLTSDLLPYRGKRIMAAALVDADGQMVQKINFAVLNGKSAGQLLIRDQISPGIYQFIVYDPAKSNPSILSITEFLIVSKQKLVLAIPSPKPITFFFEGGHLIEGLPNKVVIKGLSQKQGQLKKNNQETVTRFIGNSLGMSSLEFTPQKTDLYYIELDGDSTKYYLTPAEKDGCTLRIANSQHDNSITLEVGFPPQSKPGNNDNYLVVTNRRKIVYAGLVSLTDDKYLVSLANKPSINGLCEAVVLNKSGDVIAKRLFVVERSVIVASASLSKNAFGQREEIDIEVKLVDSKGSPLQGDFSVGVTQQEFFSRSPSTNNFLPPLYLNEFNKEISLATSINEIKMELLNDYLITKNWTLTPWKDIFAKKSAINEPPLSILTLNGKAYFKNSLKPVPDSTLIFGYLQKSMIGYECYTTKEGSFKLPFLFDFWGEDQLFYRMEYKGKDLEGDYTIVQEEYDLKTDKAPAYLASDTNDSYGSYILKKNLVNQSFNFFSSKSVKNQNAINLNERFEDEAMGADLTVNVGDYVVFSKMEDLIKEVIPFLEHRKKGDRHFVKLLIKHKTYYRKPTGEPLFVIDGILTKNTDFFLSLSPHDVITIKLINDLNKLSHLGLIGKNGVVLVQTKKPQLVRLSENRNTINILGLNQPIAFYMPDRLGIAKQRVPYLKSNLYWNPNVAVNDQGEAMIKFCTSDDIGMMRVIIKGISKDGTPFETETSFEVVLKPN